MSAPGDNGDSENNDEMRVSTERLFIDNGRQLIQLGQSENQGQANLEGTSSENVANDNSNGGIRFTDDLASASGQSSKKSMVDVAQSVLSPSCTCSSLRRGLVPPHRLLKKRAFLSYSSKSTRSSHISSSSLTSCSVNTAMNNGT